MVYITASCRGAFSIILAVLGLPVMSWFGVLVHGLGCCGYRAVLRKVRDWVAWVQAGRPPRASIGSC